MTTFAVVAAAFGAGLSSTVIIILGMANLLGDGFSMGASAYLSKKSERDLKLKQGQGADGAKPLVDGVATFAAFVLVGFTPLISYVGDAVAGDPIDPTTLFVTSAVLTAGVFLSIGLLKARVTHTSKLHAAGETLALGAVAALLAFLMGDVLARAVTH